MGPWYDDRLALYRHLTVMLCYVDLVMHIGLNE